MLTWQSAQIGNYRAVKVHELNRKWWWVASKGVRGFVKNGSTRITSGEHGGKEWAAHISL